MSLKAFFVEVKEVHNRVVKIMAEDAKVATELVADGQGEQIGEAEYGYTLDSDVWTIRDEAGNFYDNMDKLEQESWVG